MIERDFVTLKMKEFQIREFIGNSLKRVGHSFTTVQRTPLGEKIIIYASKPGLVVGRKGENIKKLTRTLKKRFDLENPQIEISEIDDPNLDAQIVAERIANSLEKFGTTKFKGVGHRAMQEAMGSGALGIEIVISGKIPSSRAKSWRFYRGYLKKCGDIAEIGIRNAKTYAQLKTGTIGIKVSIMPPDIKLPDSVEILKENVEIVEEIEEGEETEEEKVEEKEKSKGKGKEGVSKKKKEKKLKKEEKPKKEEGKKAKK